MTKSATFALSEAGIRKLASLDATASTLRHDASAAVLVVVEHIDTLGNWSLAGEFAELVVLGGLVEPSPRLATTLVAGYDATPLSGITVAHIGSSDRVAYVAVSTVPCEAKGPGGRVLTFDSVTSEALRAFKESSQSQNVQSFAQNLRNRLLDLFSLELSLHRVRLASAARGLTGANPEGSISTANALVDARAFYEESMQLLASYGSARKREGRLLASAIGSIDSLGLVIATMQLAQNQQIAEVLRSNDRRERDRDARRDRRLTTIATAFLLPSVWFGFLGTNAVPAKLFGLSVQSDYFLGIVAALGVALGLGGWLIARLTSRATKEGQTNDKSGL